VEGVPGQVVKVVEVETGQPLAASSQILELVLPTNDRHHTTQHDTTRHDTRTTQRKYVRVCKGRDLVARHTTQRKWWYPKSREVRLRQCE
jgi:hypothetical protein